MGQQPMAQCVAVTRHHYYLNQLTQKTINLGEKMNNLIHKKLGIAVISGCLMMWVGIAQAADLVVFSNGGVADADDVNANFNELGARIETISLTPGPAGAAGLGAVVFNSAPKVTDDMNSHTVGTVWIDTSGPTAYILVDSTAGGAVWTALGGSATGSLYAIGDTGPAGGIVFHVTDGGLHGLEAAAEDLTKSRWGCERTIIAGANGTAVGTGEQNTADITEFCDEITAAKVAAASGLGWYLPTKDELNLLYAQKDVVGGFSHAAFYWSSSQYSASDAWGQNFGFAVFFRPLNKFGTVGVRAVRAF
jgi:hypothetical protein